MFSRPLTHTQWLDELAGETAAEVKTRGYEVVA
jgi:hypothetical protein